MTCHDIIGTGGPSEVVQIKTNTSLSQGHLLILLPFSSWLQKGEPSIGYAYTMCV